MGWKYLEQPKTMLAKRSLVSEFVNMEPAPYDRMPVKAKEFWTLVKDESAPNRDDPTRVLNRYLLRTALAGGGPASNAAHGKKLVDFREMYVKCLHAWNAWRKGETTNLNYYAKADVPSVSK